MEKCLDRAPDGSAQVPLRDELPGLAIVWSHWLIQRTTDRHESSSWCVAGWELLQCYSWVDDALVQVRRLPLPTWWTVSQNPVEDDRPISVFDAQENSKSWLSSRKMGQVVEYPIQLRKDEPRQARRISVFEI